VLRVNVAACGLDEVWGRGEFRAAYSTLTERLGGKVLGATVWEMQAGEKQGPYHYHHGVEEWMYVVSGAPVLRDPSGERTLGPGDFVAFQSGPVGVHTMHGPGRIVMFSAGATGWGESFVTVYPDSDKVAAAPGVMFRRADAVASSAREAQVNAESVPARDENPVVNLVSIPAQALPEHELLRRAGARGMRLGPVVGAQTFAANLLELAPGDAAAAYRYEWCREEWVLVLSGAPTLRHPGGENVLQPGDLLGFPQGPTGARQFINHSHDMARVVVFSTPAGRPMSAFYPDDGMVEIRISEQQGFLFRLSDQIDDYWDGEPGALVAQW
jgi:uncharacterized cupin superfamily protein